MGIGGEGTAATTAATTSASAGGKPAAGEQTAACAGRETPQTPTGDRDRANGSNGLEQSGIALSDRDRLRITLLRNVRYNEDRQAFFVTLNGLLNLGVLMSGTGVVATLTTRHQGWSRDIAILTAVIGAVQLIFDFGRRQYLHESLRARFLGLLAKLREDNITEIRGEADAIYSEEPPTYYAVDALAFNAAQKALRRPLETLKVVTRWQRVFKDVRRFTDTDFKRAGDAKP